MKKENILILSVSGIGNTILQSPMIKHLLKQEHFSVDILFANKAVQSIFTGTAEIHQSYILPGKWNERLKLIKSLRKNKYTYSIACFPSNRAEFHLFPFLVGAKIRIIHSYTVGSLKTFSFLSNIKIPAQKGLHDLEQNINLLKYFNVLLETVDRTLIFANSEKNKEYAKNFIIKNSLENLRLAGIHAGCKKDEDFRRWPESKFIEIINKLNLDGFFCLLFAGPDEKETTKKIYSQLQNKKSNLIVEESDLNNVGALIEKCRLFLNTDSGLGHIATAMNVKTYAIFGPAQWSRTAPYGKHGNYISLNLKCSPCLKYPFESTKFEVHCPYAFKCLNHLEADEVYTKLKIK